jgi:hypothetical protein
LVSSAKKAYTDTNDDNEDESNNDFESSTNWNPNPRYRLPGGRMIVNKKMTTLLDTNTRVTRDITKHSSNNNKTIF